MKSLCIIVSAALFASPAFARIGETEAQIEKRYGKPKFTFSQGDELPSKGYISAGLRITVTYVDGVSESEFYQKPDQSALSETEIKTLLAANAEDGIWAEQPEVLGSVHTWKIAAKNRIASYVDRLNSLTVATTRCTELSLQQTARKEKAKLKGF